MFLLDFPRRVKEVQFALKATRMARFPWKQGMVGSTMWRRHAARARHEPRVLSGQGREWQNPSRGLM